MLRISHKIVVAVALPAMLSACTTPRLTTLATINAGKTKYLHQHFSIDSLPPGILKKLPKTYAPHADFRTLDIHLRGVYRRNGHYSNRTIDSHIERTSNNLTQEIKVLSENNIPFLIVFSINYGGIIWMKDQTARYQFKYANIPIITKQITDISRDLFSLKNNQIFKIHLIQGKDYPNSEDDKTSSYCRAGIEFPASNISSNLEGKAQNLACNDYVNGILNEKVTYIMLKQYRYAVLVKENLDNAKISEKIINVTIH